MISYSKLVAKQSTSIVPKISDYSIFWYKALSIGKTVCEKRSTKPLMLAEKLESLLRKFLDEPGT